MSARWRMSFTSKQNPWYHNLPLRANSTLWHHYSGLSGKRELFDKLLFLFGLRCHRCGTRLGRSSFALTALVLTVNPGVLPLHYFFQLRLQISEGKTRDWTGLTPGDREDRVVKRTVTLREQYEKTAHALRLSRRPSSAVTWDHNITQENNK